MTNFLPTLSVLVVEAHEDGSDFTAEVLRRHGFRVTIARTGGTALELAADDPPDVALLDVVLPDLDGWEVARWLREQSKGTGKPPFLVAVSGCGSDADRQRSNLAGIDLHLVKPVAPAVLIGVLKRFWQVIAPTRPLLVAPFPDGIA